MRPFAWLLLALLGCGGNAALVPCNSGDPQRACLVSDSPRAAVATAAVAGGVWVAAGGCNINGCQPPYTCNAKTELCERMKCREGRACPEGFTCNMTTLECR